MNFVVCDFDGVLTRIMDDDGNRDFSSYLNCDPSTYAPCEELVKRLKDICNVANAKVVISSNWRRVGDDMFWIYSGKKFKNQLPVLKEMLGPLYYGDLPNDEHITKSEALKLWLDLNSDVSPNYVIFDDDEREGYQDDPTFRSRFIQTDFRFGINDDDCANAIEILLGE